jgi:hypothetical protein
MRRLNHPSLWRFFNKVRRLWRVVLNAAKPYLEQRLATFRSDLKAHLATRQ